MKKVIAAIALAVFAQGAMAKTKIYNSSPTPTPPCFVQFSYHAINVYAITAIKYDSHYEVVRIMHGGHYEGGYTSLAVGKNQTPASAVKTVAEAILRAEKLCQLL